MSTAKIGGKIVLEGESQYRAALKGIKTDQSELRSEMKLCQSTFRENRNSLETLKKKHEILAKQVTLQTEKTDVYRQAMDASSKMQDTAARKMEELNAALNSAQKEMEEMSNNSDTTSEALEAQTKLISELTGKLSDAETNYDYAGNKVKYYQTALNNAEAELQGMQRELDKTEAYIGEAENATDHCATSIDEYGNEVVEASKETSVFGDVLKANLVSDAIKSGIKALADGIKEISKATVETGSSFEASMSQVAATMGITTEEIHKGSAEYTLLSDAAKECGKSTMFSASEAGEALNYLALAGYNAEKSAATLPKVLDLAAAGGLDLAYASDLVTDSMAALGMETDQLDNYIDKMARTSQKSNTSVAQLGEATLVCAGTVSLAGQSLETMNTELGILANNGIKGAEGGTHVRNVILSLSAPTESAAIAMEELGLKVSDSQGNMRDLNDIITDLDASMAGMSSTEKTQMISRIFNKTDIAAVNALLKGTGDEYDNLYREISNCSGAAADMAATLNDNLKGKVTILQSALEGLGISAYEIFDDEMKKSVDSATDAVGRLQKSMDSGDLGVSMRKFSKSLGELVDGAVDFGEDALPVVIDGLTWLLDNSDVVAAGITGIVAANLQMKVAGPAVEIVTAAWNTYKLANEGATVSQWLLNTAMNANPAGILVTALVSLTAAVAAYAVMNKDNCYILDETTGATKKLVDASRELNESYASSISDRKAVRDGMEAEAVNCRKLVDELNVLRSKTDLTVVEQARMQMIVDELNQAMPDLNLAIDEQTGLLNMSAGALEDNVEAMMAMAKAEAAREDLLKIAEDQYEAEKQLAELEEQLEEQKKTVADAQQQYNDKLEETNRVYGGQIELYETMMAKEAYALGNAQNAQTALEEQINATQESIEGFTSEYVETMDYIADVESWEAASTKASELGEAAGTTGDKFSSLSDQAREALTEMQTDLTETISGQMDLFSKFNSEMELTTTELLANMQSQIDGITQWSENLAALAERGIDQGLLKSLEDMGPAGAGYVATFVAMTDEELQKANDLFAESISLPSEAAASAVESYMEAGTMAAEGFKQGIEESSEEAGNVAAKMAEYALELMEKVLDIHSPSKKTEQMGENFDAGFGGGIKEGKSDVLNIVEDMCTEIVKASEKELHTKTFTDIGKQVSVGLESGIRSGKNAMINVVNVMCTETVRIAQNGLQTGTFTNIGRQVPAGLESGIRAGKSGVIAAVEEMCSEAVKKAKSELEIHSPSRKFEYMGEMSGEGYIEGWERSMANINAVIAASLPETSLGVPGRYIGVERENIPEEYAFKKIDVSQEINIYSKTDNLVEMSRQFARTQKEAATLW